MVFGIEVFAYKLVREQVRAGFQSVWSSIVVVQGRDGLTEEQGRVDL